MADGFFYSVKAIVDKNSFAEGARELEKLAQSSKVLIAGITGAGAGLIATAGLAGKLAQQELATARAVGVSTEALAGWKTAVGAAGASANGLIGSLSALDTKMQHLKTGTVDMGLAKNLGMLGISYTDFADMDSESRMRSVFGRAGRMQDQQLAATLVGDVLGSAGKEYYESLKASGKSLEQQLAEGRALNFVSERNRKEAALFAGEAGKIKEAGKSIVQLFGSELAKALTPSAAKVRNYLIQNRDKIRQGIAGVAQSAASVLEMIAGAAGKIAPFLERLIDGFGGLDKVIIKVGAGFAALKVAQLAGGIGQLVSGVNLLKMALSGIGKGLVAGGLFLLIDDLAGYLSGKRKSVTGYVINHIDELKEKLKGIVGTENFDKISAALEKIKDVIGAVKKSLPELGTLWKSTFKDVLRDSIESAADLLATFSDMVSWIAGAADAFNNGGMSGGAEYLRASAMSGLESLSHAMDEGINKALSKDGLKGSDWKNLGGAQQFLYKLKGLYYMADDAVSNSPLGKMNGAANSTGAAVRKSGGIIKSNMNDGIVSPDGRIIGISPSDWVFAVKDIADLAGAFMPYGAAAGNSISAPSSYVINQTLNVGGGVRAQEVQAYAYRGTAEALRHGLDNAARIMQFMPGTR